MKTEKDNSNYLIQGFQPGVLRTITARPSQGKSLFIDTESIKLNRQLGTEYRSLANIIKTINVSKEKFIVFDTTKEIDNYMKAMYNKHIDQKSIRFKGGK